MGDVDEAGRRGAALQREGVERRRRGRAAWGDGGAALQREGGVGRQWDGVGSTGGSTGGVRGERTDRARDLVVLYVRGERRRLGFWGEMFAGWAVY